MSHDSIVLTNDTLSVELDPGKPIVLRYVVYTASDPTFGGGNVDGKICINGNPIRWEQWETSVTRDRESVSYRMRLSEKGLSIAWRFALHGNTLVLCLEEVDDPGGVLEEIGWRDLPLLVCQDEGYDYWRMFTKPPDPSVGHKMWATDAMGSLAGLATEDRSAPVIYGAIWNNAVCAFVDSNYPVFPITHWKRADGTYAIALNTYQYRVREKTMPLLKVTVGFLSDTNGDGRADVSDYRLWINRSRPKGDPLYYDTVAYKIFMHYAPPGVGVCTNLDESEAIIRAFYHITDGLPQIIYLVGQQTGGHDGAYPTLGGGVNPEIGAETRLRQLFTTCKEKYNAILSYHTNIDDAYGHSKDWDERYVVVSGSPGQDALNVHGSICHTRDVETGEIFRRLEEYIACFPVERTLHIDNLRLTNTYNRQGWEGIGVLEELICGIMPVTDWLNKRGVTITTEGYNGMPIDPSCIVSGFWHHDPPDRMRQILHRRISGGGRGSHHGMHTVYDYGVCNSFHFDITARPWPPDNLPEDVRKKYFDWMPMKNLTWTLKDNWKEIKDCLYLGTLLHHFYNEREMLIWDDVGQGRKITCAGGVVAEVCVASKDSLKVTMGDLTIADGNDRFIPRGRAIYAYSKDGGDRTWTLPVEFRGKALNIFTLTESGRGPAPMYDLSETTIRLALQPGVPVKIESAGHANR